MMLEKAKAELENWPEPYEEAKEHLEIENMDSSQSASTSQATDRTDGSEFRSNARPVVREFSLRSRSTCRDPVTIRRDDDDEDDDLSQTPTIRGRANKRKERPSSGSSKDDGYEILSDSDSPPTAILHAGLLVGS
jgi:hypothetical protein